MTKLRIPTFELSNFLPGEVEAITGVSTALLRDWRRRKIIHPHFDRGPDGFPLDIVSELMLLRALSEHGIGPKTVFGWTGPLGDKIMHFALDDSAAWATADDYSHWERESRGELDLPAGVTSKKRPPAPVDRFAVIAPGKSPTSASQPGDLIRRLGAPVATIIDLEALGETLRMRAGKPLGRLSGWNEIVLH